MNGELYMSSESLVEVGKIISRDKQNRKEIHRTFIKEKYNNVNNEKNDISIGNIVNKKNMDTTKVAKVEMSPHERFVRDEIYSIEMNYMWEETFQGIENIANDAASEAVGIQSSLIYGTTYLILTPFAAMGLCAIGVGKYMFR